MFTSYVLTSISHRIRYLHDVKTKRESQLNKTVTGHLRVVRTGKRVQFFLRERPDDRSGRYIRKKDIGIAKAIAQKDYDVKLLAAVSHELTFLEKIQKSYPQPSAENVIEQLSPDRQSLIEPIVVSDEDFRRNWEAVAFEPKGIAEGAPEYTTDKGEQVRSKSELIIANLLSKLGIPYRYEAPLALKRFGTVYPDFTILNMRTRNTIYYEHFGMMDDIDYCNKALMKIQHYVENGFYPGESFFFTFETGSVSISLRLLENQFRHYFM